MNCFYSSCGMKPHPQMVASSRVERVVPISFLTAPTNVRIVANAGIDYSSENNLSETDSISHEISEAMDIDYLIRGTRKKRKTTTMAENVASTSEEKRNNVVWRNVTRCKWILLLPQLKQLILLFLLQ